MEKIKKDFEDFLELFLKENNKNNENNLMDILKDVILGGKRLRPILVLEIATYLNPDWKNNQEFNKKIYNFALMLELIHSTSLIIDDLPSMDNDTYRRGNLTFHAKYGQKNTYLMVYNLLVLIKSLIIENDDKTLWYVELEELINNEMSNLVLGQKYDLDPEWKPDNNFSRTLKIAEYKTASLFKLAFLGSFYLLEKENQENSKDLKDILGSLGLNLGMAFQLSDDFLDLSTDLKTNNYGLETSPENLKNKYLEYRTNIFNDLKKLKKLKNLKIFKKQSAIYEIVMIMDKRHFLP
jgi:geranylgeranyl diphosphate synthase type II